MESPSPHLPIDQGHRHRRCRVLTHSRPSNSWGLPNSYRNKSLWSARSFSDSRREASALPTCTIPRCPMVDLLCDCCRNGFVGDPSTASMGSAALNVIDPWSVNLQIAAPLRVPACKCSYTPASHERAYNDGAGSLSIFKTMRFVARRWKVQGRFTRLVERVRRRSI